MRRMHASTLVKVLVTVVVAFRAGLKRVIHRPKIHTSMFRMACGAGNASFTMCGNNCSGEAFALMAGETVGIHFLPIRYTNSDSMAGSTRIAIRLFGDRG